MLIRLIIAVVAAVVVSGFYRGYDSGNGIYVIDPVTMISFILATVVTVLLGSVSEGVSNGDISLPVASSASKKVPVGDREEGTVKWFNVSKGFGFITRSNGDDIFVHYRSIRGHGRRRLFDGQIVTFVIIDSDKGLQADDVDIIK